MVDRLFQIVYTLTHKPRITAKELAEMFEVSERTIYRDIDKLSSAGIPVYTSQGKNGGISILPDYVLDKTVLTTEEKSKIFESLNAVNELDFYKDNAREKLQNFFGEQYQDWLEIDFSSWGNSKSDEAVFTQIKRAILNHHYIEIVYSGKQEAQTTRTIRPLKLCFKDQDWYLYAFCCLRNDYRFFKLRRISGLTVSDTCFEPENVGKVLADASQKYCSGKSPVTVTLEISQDMAYRAYEELTGLSLMENGNLLCAVEVTDLNWFINYVLSYGSHIYVREPETIKQKVAQEIEEMSKKYGLLTP